MSVQVPLALLPRMREEGFDWQVRGLRKELVTALIKSLPKQIRKNVVPAADWAEKIVAELPDDAPTEPTESFRATLAKAIQRMTYVTVSESDFDLSRVPPHLLPTWAVVDERGRRVETGKDLSALQTKLKDRTQQSVASATSRAASRSGGAARVAGAAAGTQVERSGLTTWPDQDLPQQLDTKQAGGVIRAYPALVAEGDGPKATVGVQLLATPATVPSGCPQASAAWSCTRCRLRSPTSSPT